MTIHEIEIRRRQVWTGTALSVVLWPILVLVGCSLVPARVRPAHVAASFLKGSPKLEQRGDVAAPASAATAQTVTTLPIPAGSTITVAQSEPSSSANPARAMSVILSQPSELRTETRTETVEGAKSFTPPAPPSPVQLARGQTVVWFGVAGALCGVLAVVAFVMSFPRAGVSLAIAAVALPALGALLSSTWALVIGAAGVAAAFAYWHAHHVHVPLLAQAQKPEMLPAAA
jgi:hypothetical protein